MSAAGAVTAFVVVFPAELPDKTMVASLVLTTRYHRPLAVWVGVVAAFAVHVTLAVVAGSFISRLPSRLVDLAASVLFAVGAVLMWRAEGDEEDERAEEDHTRPADARRWEASERDRDEDGREE